MKYFRKRLSIIELIKALINTKKIDFSLWKKNKEQKSILLSKSSWSILLIGIWLTIKKKKQPVFLVPDYYCNYSLNLLKILGSKIIFYNIQENFLPDLNSIKLFEDPDICIATHYFGKEHDFNKISDYCSSKKILLLEDATHCLKKAGNIGNYGEFTIFSHHKFFSSINGASLCFNDKKLVDEDLNFFSDKANCLSLLEKFIKDNNIYTYNNNFRFLINLVYDFLIKRFKKEKIENFDDDGNFEKRHSHPKIDFFSLKLLSLSIQNIGFIEDYRKRCHLIAEIYLEKIFNIHDYEILSDIKYNPYLLVLKSKHKTKEIYSNLKQNGIAVQTWPDLPNGINENSNAINFRNHLIFIPLNKICLKKIPLKENLSEHFSFKLKECLNKKEWDLLIDKFETNILQTWEFGKFKKRLFFINSRRFVINDSNNQTIGIFQSIIYTLLFFKIIFINRGPIFKENCDIYSKKKITDKIIKNLKKNLFTFIYIKPEIEFLKQNLLVKSRQKYLHYKYPSWCSSKIKLDENELDIFKNFKNSLRNEIIKGQKNLSVEIIDQKKNCEWIFKRYFSKKNKKKYKTISKNLFKYLDEEKIISICAKSKGEICAGIIIYCHGKSSTYLISYNSNISRKNYGNQFLLWEAIKYLKVKKYKELDLGGIDIDNNSSVAKFKLAFNGKLYKLIGTNLI